MESTRCNCLPCGAVMLPCTRKQMHPADVYDGARTSCRRSRADLCGFFSNAARHHPDVVHGCATRQSTSATPYRSAATPPDFHSSINRPGPAGATPGATAPRLREDVGNPLRNGAGQGGDLSSKAGLRAGRGRRGASGGPERTTKGVIFGDFSVCPVEWPGGEHPGFALYRLKN